MNNNIQLDFFRYFYIKVAKFLSFPTTLRNRVEQSVDYKYYITTI